jgi:hypothetical protein
MSEQRRRRRKMQREYEKYMREIRRDAFKRAEEQKEEK